LQQQQQLVALQCKVETVKAACTAAAAAAALTAVAAAKTPRGLAASEVIGTLAAADTCGACDTDSRALLSISSSSNGMSTRDDPGGGSTELSGAGTAPGSAPAAAALRWFLAGVQLNTSSCCTPNYYPLSTNEANQVRFMAVMTQLLVVKL
jgi:hypothetical protein